MGWLNAYATILKYNNLGRENLNPKYLYWKTSYNVNQFGYRINWFLFTNLTIVFYQLNYRYN
jgi:hypothetical protein